MLWEVSLSPYTVLFFAPYSLVWCSSENQPCSHCSPWFSTPEDAPCYRSTSLQEDTVESAVNSCIQEIRSLFSNSCFLPQKLHTPQQRRGCCHGGGFICSLARVPLPCSQLIGRHAHRAALWGYITYWWKRGIEMKGPRRTRKNTEWARPGCMKPVLITLFQFN